MDTCKFIEDFTRATNGEFDMLKFAGATFYKDTAFLNVKFLISAFDYKAFMDNAESVKKVEDAVAMLCSGIKTSVSFIKTYADENVVRNKVAEFFNSTNSMIFKRVNSRSVGVTVEDDVIRVELCFDAAILRMLEAGTQLDDLKFALERAFIQRIEVALKECESESEEDEAFVETTVKTGSSLRLVEIIIKEKLYARNKIESINQMPNYIADIKTPGENIVLCGRVSGLSRRKFKNKRYDPNDKKSGPEELPIISFFLNDTTGKMETVCFPKPDEADRLEATLKDGVQVVCTGRVAVSAYSGNLSYSVNAIFACDIDFESIHPIERQPVPDRYETVKPKPYSSVAERGFLDDGAAKVDEYMSDKAFVVFDLETTSTQISTTEIIEIGALRIDRGAITSFETLVKPKEHIPEGATAVNHITDAMVAFAPPIEKVIPDFYKFAEGATLVGHNIDAFDAPIIRRIGAERGYYFDNDTADTFLLAKQYMPERRSFSLENIARDLALTHSNAHRALSDVEATFELFKELLRRKYEKYKKL